MWPVLLYIWSANECALKLDHWPHNSCRLHLFHQSITEIIKQNFPIISTKPTLCFRGEKSPYSPESFPQLSKACLKLLNHTIVHIPDNAAKIYLNKLILWHFFPKQSPGSILKTDNHNSRVNCKNMKSSILNIWYFSLNTNAHQELNQVLFYIYWK